MPTLPVRAAAYTRTGILRRFLEQLSDSLPARVDHAYAETRLGLKGGDVRAFLQSVRVLGLVDPYGYTTDRARRVRAAGQRDAEMREALREAYPELVERWEAYGGMAREEVEDFFKVEYGLSVSSAGPAAKLFIDLMREFGSRAPARSAEPVRLSPPEPRAPGRSAAAPPPSSPPVAPAAASPSAAPAGDVRLAALDTIRAALKIDINEQWDEQRIELVFDRMERLVEKILDAER
ncbi:MAG: DUF5343 domain-containing protein [Armatimonadota bacterium]